MTYRTIASIRGSIDVPPSWSTEWLWSILLSKTLFMIKIMWSMNKVFTSETITCDIINVVTELKIIQAIFPIHNIHNTTINGNYFLINLLSTKYDYLIGVCSTSTSIWISSQFLSQESRITYHNTSNIT